MVEIELKFQVPAARRDAVQRFVAAGAAPRRVRLQAAYVDTADRRLARAGLALRLRREGRHWVQTLKGAGDDGLSRHEHDVPLAPGEVDPAAPLPDPRRHAGTAVGERLLRVLGEAPDDPLVLRYRSDIRRLTRRLRSPHGPVELAFDEGWLGAAGGRVAVCELEIELLDGHPQAVLDVAARWAPRFGLWLDSRSKAERGDLLARGQDCAPPRRAGEVAMRPGHDGRQALQALVAGVREQIVANASQVASGRFEAGHLHQLRVGLRRLRSGLALLEPVAEVGALADAAAEVFRRLGAASDAQAMSTGLAPALAEALAELADWAGPLPQGLAIEDGAWAAPADAGEPADAVVRDPRTQALLLSLIEAGLPPRPVPVQRRRAGHTDGPGQAVTAGQPARSAGSLGPSGSTAPPGSAAPTGDAPALRRVLKVRLDRWHRQVLREAERLQALDEPGRHRLRKRVKRLRYAAEAAAGLFDAEVLKERLRPLRAVQRALGTLNDLALAGRALAAAGVADAPRGFALGWIAARRDAQLAEAARAAQALRQAKRPWKR